MVERSFGTPHVQFFNRGRSQQVVESKPRERDHDCSEARQSDPAGNVRLRSAVLSARGQNVWTESISACDKARD